MEGSFLILFFNFGLGSSVQYFIGKGLLNPKSTSRVSTILMLIAVAILVGLNISGVFTHGFNYTTRYFLFYILLYAIFGVWQELNYSVCISLKRINRVNYNILLGPLIILALYLLTWNGIIELTFAQVLLLAALNQFFIGLVSIRTIATSSEKKITKSPVSIKEIFSFGSIVYLTNIVQFLVYRFDYWVLEYYDIEKFAYYTLTAQMVSFLWFIPQRASDIAYVHTAEDEDGISTKVRRTLGLMIYFLIAMGFVFCFGFFVALYLLDLAPFYQSVKYFIYLLIPSSLFGASIILSAYQAGRRRLSINLWGSILSCIMAILLSLTLIPRYGVWGAIIESSITYSFTFLFHYYYFKKYCAIDFKTLIWEPLTEMRKFLNEKDFSISKFISERD